jgi:hypothetical protein
MEFNDLMKVRHIYMMPESVFKANSEIVEKHGSIRMTRGREV